MPRTVVDSCIKQLQQIGVIATESRGNVSFYLLDSKDITARHIQIITAAIPRGTDLQELVLSIAVKNRLTLDKTKQLAMLVSGVRTVVKAQRLIHESTIQTFDEEMKAAKRLIEDAMSEGRYTPEVEQISSSMQTVNKTRVSMKNTEKRSVIEQSTKEQEQLFSRIDNIRSQLIRFTMRYARVNIDNAEDIVSQTTLHAWKYARTHDLTGIDNTGLRKLMIYMVKRTAITFLKNPQGSRGLGEKAIIPTFISISDIEAENGSDTNSYFRYRKQLSQHEKGYTDIENADEFKQNFKFKFSIINMPTKQRQVIILRTLFSLSLQEIAQILNINMVTTEAHSYQASLVLKNALT
jgi:RNA polymerase sigma factor (sigma-70 family)